jgi:hypothetical protein
MLHIKSLSPFGKGLHRECYVHPEDDKKCIKVIVHGDTKESQREKSYYAFLSKRNISWEMLPKFYGEVKTDKGNGFIFDLIRDFNGRISKTLTHYLSISDNQPPLLENILKALKALKLYLLKERIIVMTLKTDNIVFQKTNQTQGKLIIIDNIGNSEFFPISDYINFVANKKINRKWNRFENSLLQDYTHNKPFINMLKKS